MGQPREDVTLLCLECGESYVKSWYDRFQKYCSRKCSARVARRASVPNRWVAGLTAQTDQRIAVRNAKIAATVTRKIIDGKWHRGFEIGAYAGIKNGQRVIHVRSSWERTYAQKLDEDPAVLSWTYESVAIPYIFDGKRRNYVPDFLVVRDGSTIVVEVKPQSLREKPLNAAKFKAAEQWYQEKGMMFLVAEHY